MSLPDIPPSPEARIGKSAHAVLLRGAELFIQHGQPVADVSEFFTLADMVKRGELEHYRRYAMLCAEHNARAAAQEAGRPY